MDEIQIITEFIRKFKNSNFYCLKLSINLTTEKFNLTVKFLYIKSFIHVCIIPIIYRHEIKSPKLNM